MPHPGMHVDAGAPSHQPELTRVMLHPGMHNGDAGAPSHQPELIPPAMLHPGTHGDAEVPSHQPELNRAMLHSGTNVDAGAPSHQPQLTRVNGIGMWNSWTRNFPSPLLALLDLLDNSFDAALKPPPQKVSVEPISNDEDGDELNGSKRPSRTPHTSSGVLDDYTGVLHIEADKFCPPQTQQQQLLPNPVERTTGISIINNSFRDIKPIERILEVYSSAKGRDKHGEDIGEGKFAETIGENGVGLKQGCATLSDLSFVLSRNGKRLSLGVIAASLQKEEGIYLPSFHFQSEEETQLRREMEHIFGTKHIMTVGQCVKEYGEGSLSIGIGRLIGHFSKMKARGTWGEEQHVFCLVIHKPRHGHKAEIVRAAPQDAASEDRVGPSASTRHATEAAVDPQAAAASERVNNLMQELKDELPHNYIHVPNGFVVQVDGVAVDFCYWQRHLVEMSEFYANIDLNTPYSELPADWKLPKEGYTIRILCGFDPTRRPGDKNASLFIHSRQSGRLIKKDSDCRALLNLTSGGTLFAQGLTIIVDDQWGHLPLNPTKSDVAFGEQANGSIHKKNLYGWVSAMTSFFYNFHLKSYGEKRTLMTEKINLHNAHLPADATSMMPIDQSAFTRYEDIPWYVTKTGVIRTKSYGACKQVPGQDTKWRLEKSLTTPLSSQRPKKRKRDSSPSQDDDDNFPRNDGNFSQEDNAVGRLPAHDLQLPGAGLQLAVDNFPQNDGDNFSQEDDAVGQSPGAGLQLAVSQGFWSQSQSQSPSRGAQRVHSSPIVSLTQGTQSQASNSRVDRDDELQAAYEKEKAAHKKHKERKEYWKEEARKYYEGMKKQEGVVEDLQQKLVAQESRSRNGVRELELDDSINKLTEALAAEKETVEEQKKRIKESEEECAHLKARLTQNGGKGALVVDRDAEMAKLKRALDFETKLRIIAERERDSEKEMRIAAAERNEVLDSKMKSLSQDESCSY